MDALSEVLRIIEIESAFFFNGEFSAPWSFQSPESCKLAPYIHQPDGHVIVYHLLTEGRATAKLDDNTRLSLGAGDIVIFPHGNPHSLESGDAARPFNGEGALQQIFADGLKVARIGGGGEVTRFVCGYMVCDPDLSTVLLSGLPPMFKVSIRDEESGQWLEQSIRYSIAQVDGCDAGSKAVMGKLCATLFAETLRRYVAASPLQQRGWLAGVLDPEIGRVLSVMHREPAKPWTIAQLAEHAGMSRSVLAARFRQYLGEPPVAYLTRWRLHLGARLLGKTSYSVVRIATEVGYDSEAAFNRAFKRQFGNPPARYRVRAKGAAD
ncbi:MAG TPA: AraC family transcriptional regulator [Terriglobales bacterium]|nr:AraC family transcriptional regulator [Terriglobales bacterium]